MAQVAHLVKHTVEPVSPRIEPPDKMDPGVDSRVGHGMFPAVNGEGGYGGGMGSPGFMPVGKLLRPRSPTRQCSIPKSDSSHFSLALMECQVGSAASEHIFHVQEHELVCAVSAQTSFVDGMGCVVSSLDVHYYWCNFCTFSTDTKTLLMQHVMKHRFHCRFCRYQSFSRADIIHHSVHTHPDFRETANTTRYCTLLSDYLRVQHPNKAPLNHQHQRKRKSPSGEEHGGQQQQRRKRNKSGQNGAKHKGPDKVPAECVLFEVGVEDGEGGGGVEEGGGEVRKEADSKGSSPPSLEEAAMDGSCGSSSSSGPSRLAHPTQPKDRPASESADQSVAQGFGPVPMDGQPAAVQVSSEPVMPPHLMPEALPLSGFQPPASCSSSSGFSGGSRTTTPSPPNLSTVGVGGSQQGPAEWICIYCTFTSASQKGIKRHCLRQHRGKPFKCISPCELDERSAPPLIRYDDAKMTSSAADVDCNRGSLQVKGSVGQTVYVAGHETADTAYSDEPPVLVKQKPVEFDMSVDTSKVHTRRPHIPAERKVDLKCFHCDFKSQYLSDLRSHIFTHHRGKSLNAMDTKDNTVFLCSKSSCAFTAFSGQSFLSHAQECIPWPEQKPSDSLGQDVVESLKATTRLAEHDMVSSSLPSLMDPSKENSDEFACIHCKDGFISSRRETKRHIVECHGAMCFVMRNMVAYRKKRKALVYFCQWCVWEGENKFLHDLHGVFCPDQYKKFSDQANSQTRRLSPQETGKDEGSMTASSISVDDMGMQQAEHGEENSTAHVCPVSLISNTAEISSEITACGQPEMLVEAHSVPGSDTADQWKPADVPQGDLQEEDMQAVLSLPEIITIEDSLDPPGEEFDGTIGPADVSVTQSDVCPRLLPPDISAADKDTHVTHPSLVSTSVADNGLLPLVLIPRVNSTENIVDSLDTIPAFDTCSNSVETDFLSDLALNISFKVDSAPDVEPFNTEASQTLPDLQAVTNRPHSDEHCDSNMPTDVVCPPDLSVDVQVAGNDESQSSAPDVSGIKNDVYPKPPDIHPMDSRMTCAPPLHSADGSHSEFSMDSAPADCVVDFTDCSTPALPDITATDSVHPLQVCPDVQVSPHSALQTLLSAEHLEPADGLCEADDDERTNLSCSSSNTSGSDSSDQPQSQVCEQQVMLQGQGNSQSSDQPQNKGSEQLVMSQGQGDGQEKQRCSKPKPSRKKVKDVWVDDYEVKCLNCEYQGNSLRSLKTHMMDDHSQTVSFPFRSIHHRTLHYRSSFFACPSFDCMVYDDNESSMVNHYRENHSSQPHPYTLPSYTPAPVKCRRRTNTKPRGLKKPPRSLSQAMAQGAKAPTDCSEQYMCLYCDQNVYTDTVSAMKAHCLSNHTGQTITVRDVMAHKERRPSRFLVCDQPVCDFWTFERDQLDRHMETQHSEQLLALADRSFQCVACGWITSDDASVHRHVLEMHESEGGATVVTLAHGDEQQAVEERYITIVSDVDSQCH
ncbi:uncharacterized protein LOC143294802 [Babylonia areolata]|uniref:uncharacterized protein LOC143294802 n=1 Tax=Babylonia areolata TaxID=304850 RepID=UPI003FD35419